MLHLRLSTGTANADRVVGGLEEIEGVRRLASWDAAREHEVMVVADVDRRAADDVVDLLAELGVSEHDFVLLRADVVAPPTAAERARPESGSDSFSWVEVLGEARANARPFGRYVALMAVTAVIAGLGVITANPILIIGAMAVSPDLLPICATCVGIVLRRGELAVKAFFTLAVGLTLVVAGSLLLAVVVEAVGLLPADFAVGKGGLGALVDLEYSTILIALAAGVAAIISFETRAGAVVGVAISVATIPASAFLGVALGLGESEKALDALVLLLVNVSLLILSGSITLAIQRQVIALRRRHARGA